MRRLALLLILCASLADAQSNGEGVQFYDQDFARSPEIGLQKKAEPQAQENNQAAPATQSSNAAGLKNQNQQLPSKGTPAPREETGEPIASVTLIVNTKDAKHFTEVMAELRALQQRTGIKLKTLYGIGNPDNLPQGLREELKKAGTQILDTDKPPETYPVAQSPTWVFLTKAGEVLVEGSPKLDKYVNARGELTMPK